MSEREDPPLVGDERAMLTGWLEFHRATLLHKCEGLTGAQLAERSVPPSGMSLLGLVRHLTLIERAWFRRPFGADDDPEPLPWGEDFDHLDPDGVDDDLAAYRSEVERSRELADSIPDLDRTGLGWRGGREVTVSLRWIYLHVIEEYARHNGHADLLRERVDGATGV
jgi:uncharacterized damage-inducible protein DinB